MSETAISHETDDEKLKTLVRLYRSPKSKIFLTNNASDIYNRLKTENFPISYHDIYRLKTTVESLSRGREQRILRGRKRHLNFRKFVTFSPCHIVLG